MLFVIEIIFIFLLNILLFVVLHKRIALNNIALRQQLLFYKRTKKRPSIKNRDRLFWVIIPKLWNDWQSSLSIVTPETVIRWQNNRFRAFWTKLSRKKNLPGRPKLTQEHIDFIRFISSHNPGYGPVRIAGILMENFGIEVAPSTIEKYRVKYTGPGRDPNGWKTFLKNQASSIWCCDFFTQFKFFFIPIYVFVIMELGSRKIVHFTVTRSPDLPWIKQQFINATAWNNSPKFVIHDNSGMFGNVPRKVFNPMTGRTKSYRTSLDVWFEKSMNIKGIPTPYRAPNANAHCERVIRTLRNECLDHMIIMKERHLHKILKEYVEFYNSARYHQGIKCIPEPYPELKAVKPSNGKLLAIPVLNGLHHDFRLAA